jgi:hypothetical protein
LGNLTDFGLYGYLVYDVMVIDPSMNFSEVAIDPDNGEVLLSKQLSKEEHMMMHEMKGQHTMMNSRIMMGGQEEMMRMGPPGGMMMGGYPG